MGGARVGSACPAVKGQRACWWACLDWWPLVTMGILWGQWLGSASGQSCDAQSDDMSSSVTGGRELDLAQQRCGPPAWSPLWFPLAQWQAGAGICLRGL